MNKNNFKGFIITAAAFIICLLFSFNTFGDLGDFNDYGGGDGWDSNDWSVGGDYDSDWDYGGSSGGYYFIGGGGLDLGITIVILIVVVAAVYIKTYKNLKNAKKNMPNLSNVNTMPQIIQDHTQEITAAITKYDPSFSGDNFMGWAKEVFFTLQYAWSARDFDGVRPFEKEELYKQHQMQIQQYKNSGRINVLERININNAYMYKYVRDNEYEYLTIFLNTRMVDYIKDEKTGAVLKGNPNADCYPKYLYTFMRKTGVLTHPGISNKSTTNCPNCGAPTQITSSGKCEYCDSVITTGEFDWVLSNIEGVKKNAPITQGGVFIKTN